MWSNMLFLQNSACVENNTRSKSCFHGATKVKSEFEIILWHLQLNPSDKSVQKEDILICRFRDQSYLGQFKNI